MRLSSKESCLKARLLPATAAQHVCCACRWSFDAPVWQTVSPEAQVLIRSCLRRAPWRRPTAEALLQSVWIDQAPPEKLWPASSLGKVGWRAAWDCLDLHASPCSSVQGRCLQRTLLGVHWPTGRRTMTAGCCAGNSFVKGGGCAGGQGGAAGLQVPSVSSCASPRAIPKDSAHHQCSCRGAVVTGLQLPFVGQGQPVVLPAGEWGRPAECLEFPEPVLALVGLVAGQCDGSPTALRVTKSTTYSAGAAGEQGGPAGGSQHVQQPGGQPCHASWGWGAPDGACAVRGPGAER